MKNGTFLPAWGDWRDKTAIILTVTLIADQWTKNSDNKNWIYNN